MYKSRLLRLQVTGDQQAHGVPFIGTPASREQIDLHNLVIHWALELFELGHLSDSFHEVFVDDIISFRPNGEQSGFRAHVPDVSSVEPLRQLYNRLEI